MPNASYRHIKYLAFFLFTLAGAGLLGFGCGKKGPPRVPRQPLPPTVKDLDYRIDNGIVMLSWTVPVTDNRSASYPAAVKLFRFKQSLEASNCETCPMDFTEIADLPVKVPLSKKSGSTKMSYTVVLEQGYRYVYKVNVYNEDGIGGQDSNTVEFSF